MIYTKDELIILFENSNVIVKVEGGYVINSVFQKSIKTKTKNRHCINYPSKFVGLSDMLVYTKVIEEAHIPLMYKGDISYFVRTQTKESIKILKNILNNPEIDYSVFINKTRAFYESTTAVPGFAKYLVENTWKVIYDADEEFTSTGSRKGVI